jgi:hypothetical protein
MAAGIARTAAGWGDLMPPETQPKQLTIDDLRLTIGMAVLIVNRQSEIVNQGIRNASGNRHRQYKHYVRTVSSGPIRLPMALGDRAWENAR